MRQKIITTSILLITFFTGSFGGIMVYDKYFSEKGVEVETIEKTVKEVSVTETNTIKSSIDNVFDAVVYVASYRNGSLYSTGTGFVYKKDDNYGYIITNHHVISSATEIKITDSTGKTIGAKLLGSDEYADIAVLSIDSEEVNQVAEIGDSTVLELGDTLFTVGSPLGIDYIGTVTKGILSGKERAVTVQLSSGGNFVMEVIQTDATINPGNSGGPLCNVNGEVIGVNSLKIVDDDVEGMGFAIPIEMVMGIVDRLENGERIIRPYFGIEMIEIDDTWTLYRNNISVPDDVDHGVVLGNVVKNTPASENGLKVGDILLEIDGVEVKNIAHFRYLLYKYEVNDTIEVTYYRNNKIQTVKVKLTMSADEAN